MLTSKELNEKIVDLDLHRLDLIPEALKAFNKVVPYYGFNWRTLNFDKLIWLGISPYHTLDDKEIVPWVGFLTLQKTGFKRWQTTEEQSAKIKEMLQNLATEPSIEKTTDLYNYMQGCKEPFTPLDQV